MKKVMDSPMTTDHILFIGYLSITYYVTKRVKRVETRKDRHDDVVMKELI